MEWYPKHPTDYRNDTWHLSLAEHGAYNLLIDHYMLYESPLPNNDQALAGMLAVPIDEWLLVKDAVLKMFKTSGAKLRHKRCDEELESAFQKRRDGKTRQKKHRKLLKVNDPVTGDKRVYNALEERTGEEKKGEEEKDTSYPKRKPPDDKPKSKKGTRLPDDWPLPDDWRQWAMGEGHHDPDREADKFRDYWIGKAGAGAVKLDWQATWRNWIRKTLDNPPGRGGSNPPINPIADAFASQRRAVMGGAS